MEEYRKKQVVIGVIVVCIVLTAGIYWIKRGRGLSEPGSTRPIYMLCNNPDCGKSYEITVEELREMMRAESPEGISPMRRQGQMAFKCKFCREKSAYQAEKCKKCGHIFIPDYTTRDYPDRCPKCGYSALEEKRKNPKNAK